MQEEMKAANETAWNQSPYRAWLNRYGTPQEAAAKIVRDPAGRLSALLPYLGDLNGKKAANLLGSYGGKAVPMALLGADVTVVDLSAENARYALELAEAAGARIRYLVADVLALPETELTGDYDLVLMEHGILHYFIDLAPLIQVCARLLAPGGRLVVQDFHPFTTKLISSRGTTHNTRKHKVTGDYFDDSLEEAEVSYAKFLPEEDRAGLERTRLRRWTLGEIVSAVADAGFCVKRLAEEPNRSSDVFDKGIPKTFTLAAER